MGKSLSILALAMHTKDEAETWRKNPDVDVSPENYKKRTPATLVLVPFALLINNWVNEIRSHLDGQVRFITYHGQQRKAQAPDFEDAHIVITTYHTLVSDFSKKRSPVHDMEWYRIVLDEGGVFQTWRSVHRMLT